MAPCIQWEPGRKVVKSLFGYCHRSRSATLFMKWHAQIQSGEVLEIKGSWDDNENGYTSVLRGGVLKMAPSGLHPNKNAEFVFDFEEIIPEFDGASFDPAPIF